MRARDVRRAAQPATQLVLAEADVAALVLDDAAQHLGGDRVGALRVGLEDRELHRLEDHVLREERGLPVAARDQLEQPPLEVQQRRARALLDLGFGIGDAELAQPVQQHLEVTSLVDDLRRRGTPS